MSRIIDNVRQVSVKTALVGIAVLMVLVGVSRIGAASREGIAAVTDRSSLDYWDPVDLSIPWCTVGEGTLTVHFFIRVQADYNLDGKVSIADVTKVAQHFGQDATGDEYLECVLDYYMGDGTVGIEDLQPIAMHYGLEVIGIYIEVGPSREEMRVVRVLSPSECRTESNTTLRYEVEVPAEVTDRVFAVGVPTRQVPSDFIWDYYDWEFIPWE